MATTKPNPFSTTNIALLFGQWIKNFQGVAIITFQGGPAEQIKWAAWLRNNVYFIVSARTADPKSFDKYKFNVSLPVFKTGQYTKYRNELKSLLFQLRSQLASILYGNFLPGINVKNILTSLDRLITGIKT